MKSRRKQKKVNKPYAAFSAALLLAALISAGCAESPKAKATSSPATAGAQKRLETAPTGTAGEKSQITYVYNSSGRRDPFAPILVKATSPGGTQKNAPPLERYNIYEFKLSGIIWGGFGYNAMVDGPDGKGYFVRVGTVIGLNRGVVKKITQNTMVIEEKFKTSTGETDRKEIIIELRKKQEGTP